MRRTATAVLIVTVASLALCIGWVVFAPRNALPTVDAALDVVLAVASLVFASVGRLIVRRANNRVGLVFSFAGLGGSLLACTDILVKAAPTPLPGWVPWVAWLSFVGQMLAVGSLTILLLIFPTGRIPGPRWRWAAWLWATGLTAVAASALFHGGFLDVNTPGVVNPAGISPLDPAFDISARAGGIALVVVVVAGLVSLRARSRRGGPEERAQIRWLAYVGGLALASFLLSGIGVLMPGGQNSFLSGLAWLLFIFCSIIGIPAAVAVAILKYRLYDIDVVIKKTVVVGLLALFITVVYVAIVVGVGALVTGTVALQMAATAVVAVAFQPVRELANRLANRLVYGRRATPYEVLARFADRMGDTYASEDVLVRIAHVIADGTGAERAEVWLRLGDELRMSGAWPEGQEQSLQLEDGGLPRIDADRVAPVRHHGELLGAITVSKPPSDPLTPNEAELLDRLAEQSGLVLSNVRMTADLEARLRQISRQAAELRASRQRIVAAQDEERRRLERNIHDGAQQHLVALAVKLRLARSVMERDPDRGRIMLREIRAEVDAALDTLHALALGIYPPLLEEQGIAPALTAQYRRTDLPVRLDADGLARHPIEIEAAIYFSVLEALQNAAKYADARSIEVRLAEGADAVEFEVVDDGIGFDPSANGVGTGLDGIRDRLAVFGGDVRVESQPGGGTVVRGRVPVAEGSER